MKAGTVLHHVPQGQAHTGAIIDMDCHPDNNLLITGSVDGHAAVLKTQMGQVSVWLTFKQPGWYLNFSTWFRKNILIVFQ
jgi:hypothetical protein